MAFRLAAGDQVLEQALHHREQRLERCLMFGFKEEKKDTSPHVLLINYKHILLIWERVP